MTSSTYCDCFGDKRIDKRGTELRKLLFVNATHSIQALSSTRKEQIGYYRFLHNKKSTEKKLIKEITSRCAKLSAGKVVLSIQDTTESNLSAHAGRLNTTETEDVKCGLGDIDDNKKGIGFKIHPSLVVDASNCFPIGFSDIHIWNREADMADKHERKYNKLPIEEKESYKWIQSSNNSKKVLSEAKAVIIVQDREGDIFEQWADIPDDKTFLLIRSRVDRKTTANEKLWEALAQASVLGQYELHLAADSHRKEPARTATMEVRCVVAEIQCPLHDKKNLSKTATVYAIEAKEINSGSKEPVHWRLATTWPVNTYEDILLVIEWYTWRWLIEEVFRMLKKEGFNIEASELESGWAIRKLSVMMLDTIVKLIQMHIAYNCPEGESPDTDTVFSKEEQQCLAAKNKTLEGKTEALKNPYQPKELKWAVWVIARLGGWKGYKSQQKPGMTTLFKGLEKFHLIFEGWNLTGDVCTR